MANYEYKVKLLGDPRRPSLLATFEALLNEYAQDHGRLVFLTPAKYGICGIFEREVVGKAEEIVSLAEALRALEQTDTKVKILMNCCRRGGWNDSFEQLAAIATGVYRIGGIGKARQAKLKALIAEVRREAEG